MKPESARVCPFHPRAVRLEATKNGNDQAHDVRIVALNGGKRIIVREEPHTCLLYTSDAADE